MNITLSITRVSPEKNTNTKSAKSISLPFLNVVETNQSIQKILERQQINNIVFVALEKQSKIQV